MGSGGSPPHTACAEGVSVCVPHRTHGRSAGGRAGCAGDRSDSSRHRHSCGREKYGSTAGKYQEQEGGPLAEQILHELGIGAGIIERVRFLVEHHHTYTGVDGMDYQILLEADFLVNAYEDELSPAALRSFGITCSGRRAAGSCCSRFTGLHDKKEAVYPHEYGYTASCCFKWSGQWESNPPL